MAMLAGARAACGAAGALRPGGGNGPADGGRGQAPPTARAASGERACCSDWAVGGRAKLHGAGRHRRSAVSALGLPDGIATTRYASPLPKGLARLSVQEQSKPASTVPLWVMLPLDTVTVINTLNHIKALNAGMRALRQVGVTGVMVDVWWGVVEAEGPGKYDWSAYKALFDLVESCGLKVQVVLSFHGCGANVGDSCTVTLPPWVLEVAENNPDVFYTDGSGKRNHEYLSLGVDNVALFQGRTPVQIYSDFMVSFRRAFAHDLGGLITDMSVSLGPAGELRYPSYPEKSWRFPGIGEFQCYDKYMLSNLRACAVAAGRPEWGNGGPHDAGGYLSRPQDTGFFNESAGNWSTPYGKFFLSWYSQQLLAHGDRVLGAARTVFADYPGLQLVAKLPGVHWWFRTRAHAAELTAGLYNCEGSEGYGSILAVLAKHRVSLNFTCAEMADDEQPSSAACSPEALLHQVRLEAAAAGVPVAAENALPRFDGAAHKNIIANAYPTDPALPQLSSFIYLRMGERLFHPENWHSFVRFSRSLAAEGACARPRRRLARAGRRADGSHLRHYRPADGSLQHLSQQQQQAIAAGGRGSGCACAAQPGRCSGAQGEELPAPRLGGGGRRGTEPPPPGRV